MTTPLPLRGLRVLVPRGGDWGSRVAEQLRSRGAEPTIAPLLATRPPFDESALAAAIAELNTGAFEALVVTSQNAAEAIATRGARPSAKVIVAAVGPATAAALAARGISVDVMPSNDFSAKGLAPILVERLADQPARVLLPLSNLASDTLETSLGAAGHTPIRVTAYRTVHVTPDPAIVAQLAAGEFDVALVTSGSAANVLAELRPKIHSRTWYAAIGEPSAASLRATGQQPCVVARTHTIEGLLDALERALSDSQGEAK